MAEEHQRNALAEKSRLDAMKTNKERKKAVDSPDRAGPSSAAGPSRPRPYDDDELDV